MLLALHVALAYLTVAGFVIRGSWKLMDSPRLQHKWVKISPHVIDTGLLALWVAMAVRLGISPFTGWLAAKLVGVAGYIGFGVLTLRASARPMQLVGFIGALVSVSYVFAVAFTRLVWPF